PAAQAGLQADDVIKKAGDRDIKSYQDLLNVLQAAQPGQTVRLTIEREGQTRDVTLTYGPPGGRGGRGGGGGGGGGRGGGANRPFGAQYFGQQQDVQEQQ